MFKLLLMPRFALWGLFFFVIGIALAHLTLKWQWLKRLMLIVAVLLFLAWLPSLMLIAPSNSIGDVGLGFFVLFSVMALVIPTTILLGYAAGRSGLWVADKYAPSLNRIYTALLSALPIILVTIFAVGGSIATTANRNAILASDTVSVSLNQHQFELPYVPYITIGKKGRNYNLRPWREKVPLLKSSNDNTHAISKLKAMPAIQPSIGGIGDNRARVAWEGFQTMCEKPKSAKTKKCLFSPPNQHLSFNSHSFQPDILAELSKLRERSDGKRNGVFNVYSDILPNAEQDNAIKRIVMTDSREAEFREEGTILIHCHQGSHSADSSYFCQSQIIIEDGVFLDSAGRVGRDIDKIFAEQSAKRDYGVVYWDYLKDTFGVDENRAAP